MTGGQSDFAQALLDPAAPTPAGLTNPDGAPATRRFNVYRNNVAASLTEALETAFPAIRKLIGEENFKAIAGVYLRKHPPSSPLMMFYGADMPGFLAGFEPLQHLAYLPDVARLELALRRAYHAEDASPLPPQVFETLPADRLMGARVGFAPAVQLVRSRYPVHGIWSYNMEDGAPKPAPRGENVLVSRPDYDPVLTTLAPGGGTFLAALLQGQRFAAALDATTAQVPDFDLTGTLGALFASAAIIRLDEDTTP
ncbi:MAG: DNA-binding domain-containing protein [Rhodobacter sp.]|nr:DNA-binding domain-containing protein [Rhodobacter sp.]